MIITFEIPDIDVPVLLRSSLVALYRPRTNGLQGVALEGPNDGLLLSSIANFVRQQVLNQTLKEVIETEKGVLSGKEDYGVVRDFKATATVPAGTVTVLDLKNGAKG